MATPRQAAAPASFDSMDWLGGSEMGKLIRKMAWADTPLGPLASWPQSLRTTVSLCLASNFPIALAWGPQRTQIYNDGYWPICGAKHPQSMGQDFKQCWNAPWPIIGEAFERAAGGSAAFLVNQRMFLDRAGFLEETFFTFSFSPIRDETGRVAGLFHPVTELTQQSLGERRLKALRALADGTAAARSVEQAIALAMTTLDGYALDLPFAMLYLPDADLKRARLAGQCGLPPRTPATPADIALDTSPPQCWPVASAVRLRRSELVTDLAARFGPLACGPYPEPPHSALVMPLIASGQDQVAAIFIAGISPRCALDEAYRTFFDMVGKAVNDAMASGRGFELERARADALAEIDRAKTIFFSNVSHELRTPLTLMLGPLETLSAAQPDPRSRQLLDLAYRNAMRLLKLVNSLLDFARIEAGRMQVNYSPTDLAALTATISSMFASAMESAALRFTVDCPALLHAVYVDAELWEKIVINLISNAFKFTFEGGVTVRLRWHGSEADGRAVLSVTDTGIGVAAEHLPKLFERFHRVPAARSRTYEGSGIGLAMVHELVKLHGGSVSVDSTPGVGTTFTVSVPGGAAHLPAERIAAPALAATSAANLRAYVDEAVQWLPDTAAELPAPAEAGAIRPRILWADDNADMRAYVRRLLAPYWDVETVANGRQALESALRNPPDLILTDVMMPELDGFGLLQAVRADPRIGAIPVILLSARAGEEARVDGLQAGADDYLVKPFGSRELLARIATHLGIARLRHQAVEAAQHDTLTDLPNRKLGIEFAERLLNSARRRHSRVAVLFIDMDHFKPINDTYGHQVGDAVLREVARRLKHSVRGEDTLGRLGGDEFLVVLPHIEGAASVAHAASHLVSCLSQPYRVGTLVLDSSPSIGISLFPDDGSDFDTLLRHADVAMYHAKEAGRATFQLYTPALNDSVALVLRIENQMRSGLEQGEFRLHYQPIVDVARQRVVGAEALMRWPAKGIGPSDFIAAADSNGLIGAMGAWGMDEACRQARQWLDHGLPALQLSVNISPVEFWQQSLCERIGTALKRYDMAPASLQLEFTETALFKNPDEAMAIMRRMKELGVKLALDDFGQGYSSLGRLGRLPLDAIKVDQGFITRLACPDLINETITEAIIAISKSLGLGVVAEGVESAEVQALLCARNCPQMQGYYLGSPLPGAEFETWYRQHA